MKIYRDITQGSESWDEIRLGKVTASKFKDAIAGGQGKSQRTYMDELITEIEEHRPAVRHFDKNMENGTLKEPFARQEYERRMGLTVEQVGFIELNKWIGCSPDGLIGENGMLEIKCPIGKTHTRYVREDKMVTDYVTQVQGQLWVSGRQWCDFVSYRPERDTNSFFMKRVYRDEKEIDRIKIGVTDFVARLKKELAKTRKPRF